MKEDEAEVLLVAAMGVGAGPKTEELSRGEGRTTFEGLKARAETNGGRRTTEGNQLSIHCPVCGYLFPYDRWSKQLQEIACSDKCKADLNKRFGYRSAWEIMKERAEDPNLCLMCGGSMRDKVHVAALYCSDACKQHAFREGVPNSIGNTLLRIRWDAAHAPKTVSARATRKRVDR